MIRVTRPATTMLTWTLTLIFALSVIAPASAQSDKLVAFGVGASTERLNGGDWTRNIDWFVYRIPRPNRLGLMWDLGRTTFSVPADATGADVPGTLRTHRFVFGPGYTWRSAPVEFTLGAMIGPTTNAFRADASGPFEITSRTNWAELLQAITWIDLGSRFGVKVSADYLFSRPPLVVSGSDTTWRARRLHAQVGLVFGIY